MKEVVISEDKLKQAAMKGNDAFLSVFIDAIKDVIGGELTIENMSELNSNQITLLAYQVLHDEVMDGGFIQLIHNGYGAFIYRNPLDKMFRDWGMADLCKIVRKTHALYNKYHEDIERDCTEEEFIAMYERYAEFDDYDDFFVMNEERWISDIAHYVDENIGKFATISKQ